ncbi:MAG: Holliday junction resolvase RuvX [candidate division WOR-3 bacterium]|nr:MAG: Holliday junction resolvase RuvX [candidate division WOR-3 bacterium]
MARILCLDIGERHTGVAVTDRTQTIARSLPTIHHQDQNALLAAVNKLLTTIEVSRIVVGLPLGLSGNPTARSEKVTRFSRRLGKATRIPVELFDESLSTVTANKVLNQALNPRRRAVERPATGRSRRRRDAVDRVAATVILQEYLAARPSQ